MSHFHIDPYTHLDRDGLIDSIRKKVSALMRVAYELEELEEWLRQRGLTEAAEKVHKIGRES